MIHMIYKIAYHELDMEGFIKRYHFARQDFEMIKATARFLCEITKVETWFLERTDGIICAVTLGRQYDGAAGLVADSGNLLLSYCMECLGMEFLSGGYEKINDTVHERKGVWLSRFDFLGEEDFLQIEDFFPRTGVEWENGMLRPLKSVVFKADYRSEKEDEGCHDCSNCGNITCSFRKIIERKSARAYSYGAATIFGGGEK